MFSVLVIRLRSLRLLRVSGIVMRLRMFLLLITFLKASHSFRNRLLVICKNAYLFATMIMTSVSSPFSCCSGIVRSSRARRCVEACVYGTLDFVGYPRFPAPVEFIAAVIAYYVHPVNIQTACLIMEGAEFTENIINGVERPVKAAELFAFTLRVRAGNTDVLTDAEENVRQKLRAEGVM